MTHPLDAGSQATMAAPRRRAGIHGIEIVVANRARQAEGGRSWIADAPLVEQENPGPTAAREVGGKEAHDAGADDGQVIGQGRAPSSSAGTRWIAATKDSGVSTPRN